jgi:hypothetical protein
MRMKSPDSSRHIEARVVRSGARPKDTWEWEGTTPEDRIEAVWELTLLCLAWKGNGFDEPRLQRSVVRVQRAGG